MTTSARAEAAAPSASAEVAEFVERFRSAWANPQLERFEALFHADVVLIQPLVPTMTGRPAALEGFRRLLHGFRGLHGEVLSWRGEGDTVFIELALSTTGRRPLAWTVVDRIKLEDGLIRERVSYMDSLTLLVGTMTRPAWWPRLARLQLSR
ncbi:MAG: hypothetical protein QOG09_239 [Solirubrobacterales bacterium]|nr:hypothetical protein [Solirubrobacterales bacterium]MDX6662137.1 hypothetical protein [Solirubrobacterales bacterium]